jgi:TRAP-type mannitol/chloroaromatic compound transport system substrate-binding protein
MERRSFLKKAVAGAAATTVAAPAIAQSNPKIQWRLAASWPKSLDTLFGGADLVAKRVAEITDGNFQIRTFAAGEIVPALQVLDAVQAGTVELGHTALYYYFGKDPALALICAVCFGPNTRQSNAWWYEGGGEKAAEDLMKDYNCNAILAGSTGCQMGGWYRKEINHPDDWKGLKIRIGGFGGVIMSRLGAVPQQIAGGET